MNAEIKEKLRRELLSERKGLGFAVFCVSLMLLVWAVRQVPGMDVLLKTHTWPIAVIFVVSAAIGWVVGSFRKDALKHQIWSYDDDVLKYHHDRMSRRKLLSNVVFIAAAALVAGYLLFGR